MKKITRLFSVFVCIVLFASLVIFVSAKDAEGTPPKAPMSAEYKAVEPEDLGPVLTVNLSDLNADFVIVYFGNELGRFDAELGRFAAAETTYCELNASSLVPEGTTKLWVYAANEYGLSANGCAVDMFESFSRSRIGGADAPNNTLEAYAVTVIIAAAVVSSVGYIFLRDPHKKDEDEGAQKE